jgi:hypothetical protein
LHWHALLQPVFPKTKIAAHELIFLIFVSINFGCHLPGNGWKPATFKFNSCFFLYRNRCLHAGLVINEGCNGSTVGVAVDGNLLL